MTNKKITVGYVEGYNDASETMHNIINIAIKRHNGNLLSTINEIIGGMYKQQEEVALLVDMIEKKVDEAPELFDDYNTQSEEQITIEDWVKEVFGDGQQFVIIKGGK